MTTPADETTGTERFLAAVRAELEDLPADEQSDLLEDVEQHLLEVSAEADGPLDTVLGPPEVYAAELRAAAGLPARGADEDSVVAQRLGARITKSWPGRLARRTAARLDRSSTYRQLRDFLPELRPGWWVLRGYLAVLVLAILTSGSDQRMLLVPEVFNNWLLGLVATVFAIRASVAWGRREVGPGLRLATHLGSALLVVLALVAIADDSKRVYYQASSDSPVYYGGELTGPDGPITNIYPYAADGTPLDNVLLYDQDGRPLVAGSDFYSDIIRERAECYVVRTGEICTGPPDSAQSDGPPAHLFPHPEPIIDPRTGEVTGEKSRPVVIPPAMPTPSPTATRTLGATPPPTPTPTPTKRKR